MYKVKLVVNDYERWLTALHYEYFCPVAVDERYYRKFLQKNFPYEINDADDLHPYNHRSVPSIKPNAFEKILQKQSMDEAKFANHSSVYFAANDFSSFSDTDPVKEDYYTRLGKARHTAGLDYGIAPNYTASYDKYIRPAQQMCRRTEYVKLGGIFSMQLNSGENDDFLYQWLLDGDMKNGKLVFYDGDLDQAFKIEFWDCYCIGVGEQMTSTGSSAMTMNLRISPAITRNRSEEHQKVWKVTDITPSDRAFGPGPVEEVEEQPELLKVECLGPDGKPWSKYIDEGEFIVYIQTANAIGEDVNINLGMPNRVIEFNGEVLNNNTLRHTIESNEDSITLVAKPKFK